MLFFLLRSIIFLILFICLNYNFVNGVKTGSIINIETISAEEILNSIINSTYDRRVRPPNIDSTGKNQPVKVEVNVYLRSMWNIDFVRMEYSMQLTFRETWKDARLAYSNDSKNVPEFIVITQDNLIWMPDTFFGNEKQAYRHVIDKPNMLIRIYSDGNVLYSERITLVLSCPMFMLKYPMDEQKCDMNIASYAYTTDDILYSWRVEEAIQFHPLLNNSLPCFQLETVDLADCTSSTNTGEYSCIKTIFHLKRQASYFLVHVFMPSTTLVIVSWVSFWMDRSAVPARVTLGVTTLLTIFTQAASINNSLPVVSYIKSIDIWLGACVLFVFLAVIEFAYVSFIGTQLEERKKKCDTHEETNENIQSPSSLQESLVKWKNKEEHELLSNEEKGVKSFGLWERYIGDADEAKQIDIKSRIIFPILFLIFNIFYWIWHFSL